MPKAFAFHARSFLRRQPFAGRDGKCAEEFQMKKRRFLRQSARLIAGASFLALMVACNKQPTATEAPMVAPPMAALPLAGGAPPPQSLAPVGAALAAPPTPVRYAPVRGSEGYGYIDQAYSMGQAFADTPPDYAVDYQGTRPWVWRAGDGAYRIVERLPRGERFFYYRAGQDYPFLVRDPDYSYAYDNGDLVAVYGADGDELEGAYAAGRADEASRYLYRARELYRAAQYQQRTSAYANEWGDRQDQLRHENQVWQQQQAQNSAWHSWHDSHQAQEQQQWLPERNQRLAYAAAIGLAAASRGAAPDPVQVSRRQAAYFSNWNASHGNAPASQQAAASNTTTAPTAGTAPPVAATRGGAASSPQPTKPQSATSQPATPQTATPQPIQPKKVEVASAQAKAAAAAQVQKQASEARQQNSAAAQASSAQAARDQRLAAQAQRREAAAARAKAAQDAQAQRLAAQAKQHEAAAAQAKAAEAVQQQKAANMAKQHEVAAAQAKSAEAVQQQRAASLAKQREQSAAVAKAAQAARQQKSAADAQQREAAAAQAKAIQAQRAEKSAAQEKQRETAAAQVQAAQAARAEKSAAEAKQREAAAGQAKAAQEARLKQAASPPQRENQPAPPPGKKPDHSKRKAPKDQPGDQPQ